MEIKPKSGDWAAYRAVIEDQERMAREAEEKVKTCRAELSKAENDHDRIVGILEHLRSTAPDPDGPYADLKTVEAIQAVLRNGPKAAAVIADELLEGGFQTKAQDFRNVIIVTLNQNKAPDGPFRKTDGDNEWRLDESQEIEMPLLKAGDLTSEEKP